jgi:hypothetical protein
MFEALLIVWLDFASRSQSVPIVRYETVEQCELAKAAVIDRYYQKDGWFNRLKPEDVECLKVPKVAS